MISHTEDFDVRQQFAIADLALDNDLEQRLRDALDTNRGPEIATQINEAITALIREHGVTDEGEWLGDWSAADVVRDVLTQNAITADVTPGGIWINTLYGPVTGPVPDYEEDTEDGDDNRPAIIAALATLGWQPIVDEEWVDISGGEVDGGAIRIPVRPIPGAGDPR